MAHWREDHDRLAAKAVRGKGFGLVSQEAEQLRQSLRDVDDALIAHGVRSMAASGGPVVMLNCAPMSIGVGLPGHAWSESSIKANAPQSSGVYALYGVVWIYIGESNDIQSRLLEHWNGDNACIIRANPTGFVFEICGLAERPGRQAELVARFRPLCNQRGELKPTPSM
jgi:hypothetical protein